MSDIFISYSNQDRIKAKILADALGSNGWSVWWDRKIPYGKNFDEIIEKELSEAKCVLVLWSKSSIVSNWVKEEALEAQKRNILLPILIESIQIPLGFRRIQSANLIDWTGQIDYPDFTNLVDDITNIFGLKNQSNNEVKTANEDNSTLSQASVEINKSVVSQPTNNMIQPYDNEIGPCIVMYDGVSIEKSVKEIKGKDRLSWGQFSVYPTYFIYEGRLTWILGKKQKFIFYFNKIKSFAFSDDMQESLLKTGIVMEYNNSEIFILRRVSGFAYWVDTKKMYKSLVKLSIERKIELNIPSIS